MQALPLLLFRSCSPDDLVDLTRSQSSGPVPVSLLANELENLGFRRSKFDIIADVQKNRGRGPALLDDKGAPFDVQTAEDLAKVGAQTQCRNYDRAIPARCCGRHKLSISTDLTVQFIQTRVNPTTNQMDERVDRGRSTCTLQSFFSLGEDILRVRPHEVFLVRPAME